VIPFLLPVYKRFNADISHAKGVYVYDTSGNEYLDFSAGYASLAFGHCPKELSDVMKKQVDVVWHLSNKLRIPNLELYCKELCELTGFGKSAFIANTGAEAVECGIKMARRYFSAKGYKNRYHIITLEHSFHGRTMGCISASGGSKLEGFEPPLDGFTRVRINDIDHLRSIITEDTAGIMLEPIQGEGGMKPCSYAYLKEIESICRSKGILLMLDEVQCGMGRTGKYFAFQYFGITPDILMLGKALGAGFPVSACIATEEVAKAMHLNSHGSTFGGNPIAVAIGRKVLELLKDEGVLINVKDIGKYMRSQLMDLKEEFPEIIDEITGIGLMQGIKLKEQWKNIEVSDACFANKLISTPAYGNVLRVTPALVLTKAHCDEALTKYKKTFRELKSPLIKFKNGLKQVANSLKKAYNLDNSNI
jgi:acetylornithine/N-succinyldiaminopimelate aminotransferase